MSGPKDFNIFVGGKTGILKGLQISQDVSVKNLQSAKYLTPHMEITSLSWGDEMESNILIGTKDQTVKVYDCEFMAFSSSMKTKFGSGSIVGITRFNQSITTCSQSGHIKIWKYDKEKESEWDTKGNVERMRASGVNQGIVATGGRENDLKLWNLETSQMIFAAKNVRKNELDVAVPIWVSDVAIQPDTCHHVVVCTRYGHVRLYDTKAQRKPVFEQGLVNQSLQCLSLTNREGQIVVGSGTGYILLMDLRMAGNNRVLGSFKGATGSVRQLACHKTKPYLASVGLDSYFRLHNLETKKLLRQKFLQIKLNAVLMKSNMTLDDEEPATKSEQNVVNAGEDLDTLFDGMETVGGKRVCKASG